MPILNEEENEQRNNPDSKEDEIIFVTVEASTQSHPGAGHEAPNGEMVKIGGGHQHHQPGIAVNDPIRLLPVIGKHNLGLNFYRLVFILFFLIETTERERKK